MKTSALLIAASAAIAFAQVPGVSYDNTTGIFTCEIPDGVYCAGSSLSTDIIIRCNNGVGQPGRCGNNLVGYPPLGTTIGALCWADSTKPGVAACEKNCVVRAGSGNVEGGDFNLPDCTPTFTESTTATETSTTYSASIPILTLNSTITVPTTTPTLPPYTPPVITGTGGPNPPVSNSTVITSFTANPTGPGTATPIGPTSRPVVTGAGNAQKASFGLLAAAAGVAAFL